MLELFHGRAEFNSSATLANSQLACLLLVGILNPVMFSVKYLFLIFECSAPLAPCNNHLPRVNKGYFLFLFHFFFIYLFVCLFFLQGDADSKFNCHRFTKFYKLKLTTFKKVLFIIVSFNIHGS